MHHRQLTTGPRRIAVPALDQFFPPAQTSQATAGWSNTTISLIPDADHFLAGSVDTVVTQVLAWLRSLELGPGGGGADHVHLIAGPAMSREGSIRVTPAPRRKLAPPIALFFDQADR